MMRVTISFWIFFAVSTLTGGLFGRYVSMLRRGSGTTLECVLAVGLGAIFTFSTLIILRIVRAAAQSRPHGDRRGDGRAYM